MTVTPLAIIYNLTLQGLVIFGITITIQVLLHKTLICLEYEWHTSYLQNIIYISIQTCEKLSKHLNEDFTIPIHISNLVTPSNY